MAEKPIIPFNCSLYESLNGVNTFRFNRVVASSSDEGKFTEGATRVVLVDKSVKLYGVVKETSMSMSSRIESVTLESILCLLRDTVVTNQDEMPIMRANELIYALLPKNPDGSELFWFEYNATRNPLIRYAFRSGSILTHLNTIASMSGLNWRYECEPATTAYLNQWAKIIVSDGIIDALEDPLILVENKDIFRLKLDRSLYKQYSSVTVIGVEKEISGYTTTASFLIDMETQDKEPIKNAYFYLDCDDAILGEEEILPPSDPHMYLTHLGDSDCIWLQSMRNVVGWGVNDTFRVNNEFIGYENTYSLGDANGGVTGITREKWFSSADTPHLYGQPCLITQTMPIIKALDTGILSNISPATKYFKIGSEIIQAKEITETSIKLATVNPESREYLGRGQENTRAYAHWRGAVIQPYYPNMVSTATQYKSIEVTIHAKGIISEDGCDKLAWGVLTNIQNGILSGSFTYKSSDFFDKDITVGKRFTLQTATKDIEPASTYDVMIYSIKREQNKLMTVEFGNIAPEVLQLIKSGEYALQAAVRKDSVSTSKDVDLISIGGALALESNYKTEERPTVKRKYQIGGY